jgi:hypothetical protein
VCRDRPVGDMNDPTKPQHHLFLVGTGRRVGQQNFRESLGRLADLGVLQLLQRGRRMVIEEVVETRSLQLFVAQIVRHDLEQPGFGERGAQLLRLGHHGLVAATFDRNHFPEHEW